MAVKTYTISIPQADGSTKALTLNSGELLLILGANGVGKSALIHSIWIANPASTWILAHRTLWLQSNSFALTQDDIIRVKSNIKTTDTSSGRTTDSYSNDRRRLALIALIQAENSRARNFAKAWQAKDESELKKFELSKSPIAIINSLFKGANLAIVISLNEKEQFMASKNGSVPFSIAELSDGEKNALLLCAEVLTAEALSLLLLDEPERHLHRSIISPLLSSLIKERPDCAFVISTHDLDLPVDHPSSQVVLIREVAFGQNNKALSWAIDTIQSTEDIPEDVKKDILGSRKRILFVEGTPTSLDLELYQLLFPGVSVQSKSSCIMVERAVEGIRTNAALAWVEVFGLIDADDRTPAQITALEAKHVYALPAYSIEYLYYNPDTIRAAAERFGAIYGKKPDDIIAAAMAQIIANMQKHRDRLCARLCEKRIGEKIDREKPTHKEIIAAGTKNITIDIGAEIGREMAQFDDMIAKGDINGLLNRYPFRETEVIQGIVSAFGISKELYQEAVRKMVRDDEPIVATLKTKLGNIVGAISSTITVARALPISAAAKP